MDIARNILGNTGERILNATLEMNLARLGYKTPEDMPRWALVFLGDYGAYQRPSFTMAYALSIVMHEMGYDSDIPENGGDELLDNCWKVRRKALSELRRRAEGGPIPLQTSYWIQSL